jgi:predicted P-loop ATPase
MTDNVHDINEERKARAARDEELDRIAGIDNDIDRTEEIRKFASNHPGTKIPDVEKMVRKFRAAKKEKDKAAKHAQQREQADARQMAAGLGNVIFLRDDEGRIIANMANVVTLLENHPDVKDMLYWDAFSNRPMVMHRLGEPEMHELLRYGDDTEREFPRWFGDNDYLDLLEWTQHQPEFEFVGIDVLKQAVNKRMKMTQRNPAVEWLDSLKWDGVSRIRGAFIKYWGARGGCSRVGRYNVLASKLLFKSITARIIWPGCKQDNAWAFMAEQMKGKSLMARALAIKGEYFIDCLPDLDSRDAMVMMEGKIIGELAEHVAANRRDASTTKGALSRQSNEYVQKYEKWRVSVKRTITCLSTTNERKFLADQTGNRRWIPTDICETRDLVDIDGFKADLPQLYAEAYARLKKGERYLPTPWEEEHYLKEQQEERRIEANWETIFRDYMRAIEGLNGVDVIETPNIGISSGAFAKFFETCEQFKHPVLSGAWRVVLERLGWKDKRHRLKGQGRKQRRLWALKGSDDTLDYALGWEPKSATCSRGQWRRKAVEVGDGEEISLADYIAETERLDAEISRVCLERGTWEAKKPSFAAD